MGLTAHRRPFGRQVGDNLGDTVSNLADLALLAAPAYPAAGRWTPMTYTHTERAAAAGDIANAIRQNAHMLTAEERVRLARELLSPHSTDHARNNSMINYGEPS